jgi:hypothetical protein
MDKLDRRRHFMLASAAASILIVFTVIILEIALHLAADAFPQVAIILNPSIPDAYVEAGLLDPELIYRGNPRIRNMMQMDSAMELFRTVPTSLQLEILRLMVQV